jgi:hypothetical protein
VNIPEHLLGIIAFIVVPDTSVEQDVTGGVAACFGVIAEEDMRPTHH